MPYMQISDMILGVDIIGRKVIVASAKGARGSGSVLRPQLCPLRKCLGSKVYIDWLKIDFNAAKIITCSRV